MTAVGIGLPQTAPEALGTTLELVERAGFDSAWVLEAAAVLDPLSVLAFAAARTTAVKLGVAVLVLPLHQPVLLARALATIDRLSGGRTIAGLGVGSDQLPFEAFERRREERSARFEDYLGVMRALWNDDAHAGPFVTLSGTALAPKPVQRPLPIWLGGGSPPALRRAARLADGWVAPGPAATADFARTAARVRELVGGTRPFTIAKRVLVAVDRPPVAVDAWFRAVYGRPDDLGVVAAGDAAAVTERLLETRAAGAEHVIVQPVGGGERAQLTAIAEHALPALRR